MQAFESSDEEQSGEDGVDAKIEAEWVEQANQQFLTDTLCTVRRITAERTEDFRKWTGALEEEMLRPV